MNALGKKHFAIVGITSVCMVMVIAYSSLYLFHHKGIELRYRLSTKEHADSLLRLESWTPSKTALIVVDVWNRHHCEPSQRRIEKLAPRINNILPGLRQLGVHIIFAPTHTIRHYEQGNLRKSVLATPIDSSIGKIPWRQVEEGEPYFTGLVGCEEPEKDSRSRPWTHQHEAIEIRAGDVVSDSPQEIVSYLRHHGIDTLLFAGVHSNLCLVSRPFGMRSLKSMGYRVVLIRDLTDSYLVNTSKTNYTHQELNEKAIAHIETYIGPSVHSSQFE